MADIKLVNKDYTKPQPSGIKLVNTDYTKPVSTVEQKPKIQVSKEEYKDLQKTYSALDESFKDIQKTMADISGPFDPLSIENATRVNIFGYKLDLPKIEKSKPVASEPEQPEQPEEKQDDPYKALYKIKAKELNIGDIDLEQTSPAANLNKQKLNDLYLQDLNQIKNLQGQQLIDFVNQKKAFLDKKQKEEVTKIREKQGAATINLFGYDIGVYKPTLDNMYKAATGWFTGEEPDDLEEVNLESEYANLKTGLDEAVRTVTFKKAPTLIKNIDNTLSLSDQQIRKQAEKTGNNILNAPNEADRIRFEAYEESGLEEGFGFQTLKYNQAYKDKLAYTGIQSEISVATDEIEEIVNIISEKNKKIEDLSLKLQEDPTNKAIAQEIQKIGLEIKPFATEIEKRKSFITKLSSATLDLSTIAEERFKQQEADKRDLELLDEFGSSLGRPVGITVTQLANSAIQLAKKGLILSGEATKFLGRNPDEVEITKQNILGIEGFKIPSRIKYGKALEKTGEGLLDYSVNWDIAAPLILKTAAEAYLMRKIALPFDKLGGASAIGKQASRFGGLLAGSELVFGGDMFIREIEKGLSTQEALLVSSARVAAEAFTELANPLEFMPFDGINKKVFGKALTKADFVRYVGSNWKTMFPKIKAAGLDVGTFLFNFAKSTGMESFEEVMSDLLNYGIDEAVIKNIKPDYSRDGEFTLESEIETALTTALTMPLMSGPGAYYETKQSKYMPGLRWQASQNVNTFLANLKENFNENLITKEFYETGVKEVETLSNLYNANKAKIDLAPEDERVEYLDALYQYNTVSEQFLAETSESKKEKLANEVETALTKVQEFDKEYAPLVGNPQAQRSKAEERYIENIKTFGSAENIKTASVDDLNKAKEVFADVIKDPFSPTVAAEAQKHIDLIDAEIKAREQKPAEAEQAVPLVEREGLDYLSEKVKQGEITQQEVDDLDEPGIVEKVAELKKKEKEKEAIRRVDEVSKIEDLEQRKAAIEKLQIELEENNLYTALEQLEKVSEGEKVEFKNAAEALGITEEELKAEEAAPEEQPEAPVSDKKADAQTVKNRMQEIEKTPVTINITQDAEGKMEQTSEEVISSIKSELDKIGLPYSDVVANDKGSTYFVVTKDGQQHEILRLIKTGNALVKPILAKAKWINHLIKTQPQDLYDFVNAELDDLEGKKEEVQPTELKVGDKVKVNTPKDGEGVIKEDRGDKVLLEDGRQVFKKNLSLLEGVAEPVEIEVEGETIELEPTEDVTKTESTEAPNEESDKKVVEEVADMVENPANPFTTTTFQKPSLISRIWSNSLQKIKNLAATTGKSFLELGYTVTIVNSQDIPFDNFDDDTKKYFSKGFKDNDYVEDANKRKSDTGKYAVVTNEKGEFLYFNENGEVSTSPKEGYKLAISTFPKVNEKKATKPTEKQLSLIGKTIEWYNKQVERLKSIRESKERKTLLIENILVNDNKTTNTPQDLKDYTDKVEGFNTVNGRVFLKLKGLNKPVGLTRRKLTEQEATALANILLSKAKDKPFYEGLPESLNKLVDRFNYVKNFIVTGLDYYHNINGKKTWIDLSLGKDGGKPGVYVKIGSKDAEWRLLTHDETIRLFKQLDLNISSKIPLDSAFQVFSFDGKSFKEEPSVSYGNFLVQNFPAYQKITPEGKAEDSYIEFGAELGTTEAQLEDTRVEEEPVVSDIEAKKAERRKRYYNGPANRMVQVQKDSENTLVTQEQIEEIEQVIEKAKELGWDKNRLFRQLSSMGYSYAFGVNPEGYRNYLEDRLSGKTNIKVTSEYNFFEQLDAELAALKTPNEDIEAKKADIENPKSINKQNVAGIDFLIRNIKGENITNNGENLEYFINGNKVEKDYYRKIFKQAIDNTIDSSSEELVNLVKEKLDSSDLIKRKADIERRRQEELKAETNGLRTARKGDKGIFWTQFKGNRQDNEKDQEVQVEAVSKYGVKFKGNKDFTNFQSYFYFKNTTREQQINAKYNAELAALTAASTASVSNKKDDIERRRNESLNSIVESYDKGRDLDIGKATITKADGTTETISDLKDVVTSGDPFQRLKDKINAKYDAELTALETKPEEKVVTVEKVEPVNDNPAETTEEEELTDYEVDDKESGLSELNRDKTLSSEVTEEQEKEAEEWWESTPLKNFITLRQFKNVVNSNAFATWKGGAITLWKGGQFTDLYHEAWHEFSQLYLTKEQKKALYNEAEKSKKGQEAIAKHARKLNKEVKNLTPQEKFFAIEEMLAEDFRNYAIAFKEGKATILDSRPKRNNIFRKIINFLKEFLTGKVDVQTYYERLYTGNISDYKRNTDNAFFGVLNRGLEGIVNNKKVTLSSKDSKNLFRAVDSLVNQVLQNFEKPITILFDNSKALDAVYAEVLKEFKKLAINVKKQYTEETDPERKKQLLNIFKNLDFTIQNWETQRDQNGKVVSKGLKYQHKEFSEYFAVAKEKLSFEEAEGEGINELGEDFASEDKEDAENARDASVVKNENVSSKDAASNEVLYLIASLPKYDSAGNLVENELIPGIPDLTDFKNTWDILSQNLSGITDYKTMIEKIEELGKKHKQFEELVKRLPGKNQLELTESQLRLRNAFINDLSKPTVLVHEAVMTADKQGVSFMYSLAGYKSEDTLRDEYQRNFEQDDPNANPFIQQIFGTNYLNFDLLQENFKEFFEISKSKYQEKIKELGEEEVFLQRVSFLETIGFKFLPQTLQDPEFRKEILKYDGNISNIYAALKNSNFKIVKNRTSYKEDLQKIKERIERLEKLEKETPKETDEYQKVFADLIRNYELYKQYVPLIENPIGLISDRNYGDSKGRVNNIIKIEVKNSSKYFSQSVKNAEQNTVWQIRQWSYITKIYDALNDDKKYPTYDKIKEVPWLQQLNIDVNPYANGIFLNSLFDLKTGERRKIDGKIVKIELQDYNGLRANLKKGITNPGKSTVRLTPFEKLIQNFNTLLKEGIQEHLRYGDKSSSFATKISGIFNPDPKIKNVTNQKLIIPISEFTNLVPDKAFTILKQYLRYEMLPMYNNLKYGVGNNVTYYKENIKKLGIFEGILSEKTQQKIQDILDDLVKGEEEVTSKLIDSKLSEINDLLRTDFQNYFKQQDKNFDEIIDSVKGVLNTKDYIDKTLLFTETNQKGFSLPQLKYAYIMNSFLYNVEHTKLITGDPRFYKTKYDKNGKETTGKLDPFKRFSQFTATGNLFVTDDATNKFIEKKGRGLRDALAEKDVTILNTKKLPETIMSVIFKDNEYSSDLFKVYRDYFVNKLGYPVEKANSLLAAYNKVNEADGQGFVTLDEYRESKLRAGSSHWTNAHEVAYQKEVAFFAGKRSEGMSPEERVLFVPQKWQYSGISVKKVNIKGIQLNIPIPVFYKFSVVPLIPSAIKNTPFEKIHENLIRQNVGLALFESGSKHASFTNEEGKFNNFFEDSEKRTPYTGNYTTNPIFYQYLKEQVNVEPELKEKVTFSTQMRKLITLNLFNNGIPIDYTGKKYWFSLTEQEQLEGSNFYRLKTKFSNIIDNLIAIERNNIINELGAKWNEKRKEYDIDPSKLSEFLTKEFVKRGLPDEAIEYIEATKNNKFKYPLDASVQRDAIEKILYAIADKRLVQQKISGEALIQVASTGFELNDQKFRKPTSEELKKYGFGSSDLMGYLPEGRTKKDGKKVTSASKVKISFGKKWEALLDLEDKKGNPIRITKKVVKNGVEVEVTDYEASLKNLNALIKDENWLDLKDNRKTITIVGVRIPVQGLNSQEFMEVFEFLPASTGNMIIVHPELVAKSGGDFDIDKLTTFFPNLRINSATGKAELYQKYNEKELLNLYNYLKGKYEKKIEDQETSNKIIASVFGVDVEKLTKSQIKEALDEVFSEEKLPTFQSFKDKFNKKAYENELIDTIRQILEDPANIGQLIRPNDTDLLKPTADQIKEKEIENDIKVDEKTGLRKRGVWSNLVEFKIILEQFKSNLVGKSNLGIAAVNNTFFSLAQAAGLYLNENRQVEKKVRDEKGKWRTEIVDVPTRINFPHNTIEIDGKTKISVSGLKDWRSGVEKLKNEANYISDVISQFINGFVDVAKDDWVFYINAVKEYVPSMLFLNSAGVDNETNIAYFTSPIMKEYIKEVQKYKNLFLMIKNENDYKFGKRIAIQDIMLSRMENIKDENLKLRLEKIFKLNQDYLAATDPKLKQQIGFDKNAAITNTIEYLQEKAADEQNKNLFTKEGLQKELSADEELMLLAHFEEIQKIASEITDLQRALNADTGKLVNGFSVETRKRKKQAAINSGLFGEDAIERMFNESNIKAFTNNKSGVDTFVSRLFQNTFEVLGSTEFNEWAVKKIAGVGKPKNEPKVAFEYTNTKILDLLKTLKSDILAYVFQNNAFLDNTPDAVVDIVKPYFTPLKSITKELLTFQKNYQSLKDKYPIIFNLKSDIIKSKESPTFYNLKLSTPLFEADEINNAVKQMRGLANFNDPNYTKEEQLEIQNFAKVLINFMIIQSSGRSDKYNLMNLVPGEFYSPKIAQAVEGLASKVRKGDFSDLNNFWKLFVQKRPVFFGGKFVKKAFFDYKSLKSDDLTGNKSKANLEKFTDAVEKLKSRTETVKSTKNSALIKSSPDKLFIIPSISAKKAESESEQLKKAKIENFDYVTFEGVNNDNYQNKVGEIIEKLVKKAVESKGNIVLSQEGYGKEIKEKYPFAYEYLSKQLYDIFGFTNPEYTPVDKALETVNKENFKSVVTQKLKIKPEFVGKIIYSTPGSGKTTMSMITDNVIDTDNLIVEEMVRRHPNFKQNTGESIQSFIFRYVKEHDHKSEINAIVLEKSKKLAAEGKTVLTGTMAFIKDADIVFRMNPESDRAIERFGSVEKAKEFATKEKQEVQNANKKALETKAIEESIAERLVEPTTPVVTPTQPSISVKPTIDLNREWRGDLESRPVYTKDGVNTMRTSDANTFENFGNPFSEAGYGGTIKVPSIGAAVIAYKEWLLGTNHKDVKPQQREWILDQINQGKLDGATLLYAGKSEARGQGMHPTALAEVVEQLRSKPTQAVTPTTKPSPSVQNPLVAAGIKPTDMYGNAAKDIQMASESTQFIGFGTIMKEGNVSSTDKYAKAWGTKANTGTYSNTDVIMVSGSGNFGRGGVNKLEEAQAIRNTLTNKYKPLLDRAIDAGASFRIGNQYAKGNLSDQLVAEYLQKKGYKEEKLDGYSRWIAGVKTTTQPSTQPTTEVKPAEVTERIIKKYPVEIKIEGYSLNSQDLQKIASFTSVTEEKGLTYDEIESYPDGIQRLNEYEYIDKNTADQLKDVSKTLETLVNAFEADDRDEVTDIKVFEYAKKLLDENVQLIDRNQLNLFTDEELNKLPPCG